MHRSAARARAREEGAADAPLEADRPVARSTPATVLALQRHAGNRAVARLLESGAERQPVPGHGDDRFPWPSRSPYGPHPYPPAPPLSEEEQIAREWELLAPVHKYFELQTLEFYATLRPLFLEAFGAPDVSPDIAVGRALKYYQQIVRVQFMGLPLDVHPELADALRLAEQVLGERVPLESAGGFCIRTNRNQETEMSNHSWATAIDLNASTSPNIGGMGRGSTRADIVEAVTGVDPNEDAQGGRISTEPQTFDEMLEEAERLSEASDRLVEVLGDPELTIEVAWKLANERGEPEGGVEELTERMFAAAHEEQREIDWEQRRREHERKRRKEAAERGRRYVPIEHPREPWHYEPYPDEEEDGDFPEPYPRTAPPTSGTCSATCWRTSSSRRAARTRRGCGIPSS